jgi:hypothetical protein
VLAGVLVAAGPGPDPVITVAGTSAAVKLSAAQRDALAPRVKALDAALQKAVAAKAASVKAASVKAGSAGSARAAAGQGTVAHVSMEVVHEECMRLYHEIGEQLDPAQREAFMAYLHQQMTAAGLDPVEIQHTGGRIPHAPHSSFE